VIRDFKLPAEIQMFPARPSLIVTAVLSERTCNLAPPYSKLYLVFRKALFHGIALHPQLTF